MKESNSRHATDGAAPGRLAFLHITEGVAAHTSFPSISLSLSPMLYTIQMYLIPAVHTIPAHTSLIQPLIPFYTHTHDGRPYMRWHMFGYLEELLGRPIHSSTHPLTLEWWLNTSPLSTLSLENEGPRSLCCILPRAKCLVPRHHYAAVDLFIMTTSLYRNEFCLY